MTGLPDRAGDPGDSEFGRPNITSAIPNGSASGSSEKYGTDRDTPFLDYVACYLCNAYLNKAQEEGRKFWWTSCCHILCNKHEHEKGRCTSCGKTGIKAYIIDKDMPKEMRAFVEKGDSLLARYEEAVDPTTLIVRSLKYQGDQLMRLNRLLQKQLAASQSSVAGLAQGVQTWEKEKKEWEKREAEYQVQIVNLRNIIEVNNKGLPSFPHMSPVGLAGIQEDGENGRPDVVGHLLGKRQRNDSSPRISLPPSGDGRLTLRMQGTGSNRQEGGSSSSHGSAGPAHLNGLKHNFDHLKYRPGSTAPHTPAARSGYARPGSAVPPMSGARGNIAASPFPNQAMTPRPLSIVDRLRQNGRTDRDDSPLRPSSAMQYQVAPGYHSPMISRGGTPIAEQYEAAQSQAQAQHQHVPRHPMQIQGGGQGQGHPAYPTNGFLRPAQTRF